MDLFILSKTALSSPGIDDEAKSLLTTMEEAINPKKISDINVYIEETTKKYRAETLSNMNKTLPVDLSIAEYIKGTLDFSAYNTINNNKVVSDKLLNMDTINVYVADLIKDIKTKGTDGLTSLLKPRNQELTEKYLDGMKSIINTLAIKQSQLFRENQILNEQIKDELEKLKDEKLELEAELSWLIQEQENTNVIQNTLETESKIKETESKIKETESKIKENEEKL